jgi:para-aminobenzoate synthetase component I
MNRLFSFLPEGPVRLAIQSVAQSGVDDAAFLEMVRSMAGESFSAVLLSGGHLDCARYSIAGWDPFLVFKSKGRRVEVATPAGAETLDENPLEVLDWLFEFLQPGSPLGDLPFAGGAMGYFAYDLKNQIERLPQTASDDLNLPDILLFFPRRIIIHDRLEGSLQGLFISQQESPGTPPDHFELMPGKAGFGSGALRIGSMDSNFAKQEYLDSIRRVRRYIRAGDVYQVNLSQRFQFPFHGNPFLLWEHLYAMNPSPFYAFIQAGDHQVLSTSMERFLYRRGSYIETRPIKGTRPRGKTREEDERLSLELKTSLKDDAELSMIVDLLRNDLGRACLPRTIRVTEHKRLESYQNVHHLISIVTGELREDATYGKILKAAFPGGSITGCPKIRSMEIIDELEPNVRHVYTGSIGYMGWHGNMDLNVAIRTALVHREVCYFSVGGGIVYDSNEEDEYQETLHKARTLFDLMERLESSHAAW